MILKGTATAVWGTSAVGNTSFGIVTKASHKKASEQDKIQDVNGDTVGVIFFDQTDVLSMDVICSASATPPAVGAAITIAGISAIVLDCDISWENKSTKKLTINATKWAQIA